MTAPKRRMLQLQLLQLQCLPILLMHTSTPVTSQDGMSVAATLQR